MDRLDADLETVLVDLAELPLVDLEEYEVSEFGSAVVKVILSQVDRPRKNMGTGPPGRVD